VKLKRKINLKKNQKNKDQIWKNNISQIGMEQWNWNFTKAPRKKIMNKKNKDQSWNINK
jgi:hypothetical protein